MTDLDLTSFDGLLAAVAAAQANAQRRGEILLAPSATEAPGAHGHVLEEGDELGEFTGTYCGRCGDTRRMLLIAESRQCGKLLPQAIESCQRVLASIESSRDPLLMAVGGSPPVFRATCLQCRSDLYLIVDATPPIQVIVLGGRGGGIASDETPASVTFFLDQAYRARVMAASTAAAVMYRAALEQLLEDQGFSGRTLQARIERAQAANPPWLDHLDEPLMNALRHLGNNAVHPSDSLGARAVFDRDLARDAERLFVEVLDEIYNIPAKRRARRERLIDASSPGPSDA